MWGRSPRTNLALLCGIACLSATAWSLSSTSFTSREFKCRLDVLQGCVIPQKADVVQFDTSINEAEVAGFLRIQNYINGDYLEIAPIENSSDFGGYSVLIRTTRPEGIGVENRFSKTGSQIHVRVLLTDRKHVRIFLNSNRIYGYRWDKSVFPDFVSSRLAAKYSAGIDGRRSFVTFKLNQPRLSSAWCNLFALIAFLSSMMLLRIIFDTKYNRYAESTYQETSKEFRLMIAISTLVSLAAVLISGLSSKSNSNYYARDGLTLARLPRFSDWFQLLELARYGEPYLIGQSNYPPFGLAMFRLVPESIASILLFMTIGAVLGASSRFIQMGLGLRPTKLGLVAGLALTLTSYPFIFAADRGSSELILFLMFQAICVGLLMKDENVVAISIGLMAGFKVFPILLIVTFLGRRRAIRNITLSVLVACITNIVGSLVLSGSLTESISQYIHQGNGGFFDAIDKNPQLAIRSTSMYSWMYSLKFFRHWGLGGPPINQTEQLLSLVASGLLFISFVYRSIRRNFHIATRILGIILVLLISLPLSNDYRLLVVIPVYALVAKDLKEHSKLLPIFLGVAFASKNFIYVGDTGMTTGSLITPLCLVGALLCLIMVACPERSTEAG